MTHKPLVTKTLKNGVRLVIVPEPAAQTVTALVLVGVGSAYEAKKENGLSHFLEHMCFKGTVRRPSAGTIARELESLGAVSNAFTDRELTGYYVKGNPSHLETFMDVLADIYKHSTFPEIEVQKEKGVILEEINMYEDMPQYKVGDVLFDLLYKNQPIGRTILGEKETVNSFSSRHFFAYKNRFYTGANTVVVLAGNVSVKKGEALIQKMFGDIIRSKKNEKKKVTDTQKNISIGVFNKKTDQAHLMLAFRSFALGHKELPALKILSTILGRGMSSRLFMLLREELGAAYYAQAHQEHFLQNGIFAIAAGIDKNRLAEIIDRIIGECRTMKEELVSAEELLKAKEYAIGTFKLGLELSDDVASFYGAQLVLNQKIRTPEQVIKELWAVTAKDIQRVARMIFQPKRTNLALVGPFTEADVPTDLLKSL